jgi:hypothetical protein
MINRARSLSGLSRRTKSATIYRPSFETLESRVLMSASGTLLSDTNTLKSTIKAYNTSALVYTNSLVTTRVRRNLQSVNLGLAPTAPTNLLADASVASQIGLSWSDNSTNETGFKIERSVGTTGIWSAIASVGTNVTSYQDMGLTAARTYHYRVRSSNPTGDSAYTPVASATTSAFTAPAAPSTLVAIPTGLTDLALVWADNSHNEAGFEVDRSPAGANVWGRLVNTKANINYHGDLRLTVNTGYDYRVRAVNANGSSTYAYLTARTESGAPRVDAQGRTKQFSIANLVPVADVWGNNNGFSVGKVVVSPSGLTAASGTTLYTTMLSLVPQDSSTLIATYQTANGEATIRATLTTQGDDRRMDVTVTAAVGWTVHTVVLGGARLYTQSSNDLGIYTPFKGGYVQPWLQNGWNVQGTAAWPNMSYSPLTVFFNQRTNEGVGFLAFDSGLEQRTLSWVSNAGEIHPYVTWDANIMSGQSQTTTLHQHQGFDMPNEEFQFYRNNFLIPFMNNEGIGEGTLNINGVIATNYWPKNDNVALSVAESMALGASGFFQYAPPVDGRYYEPNPQTLAWYPTLKQASQLPGLELLGVLIDPLMKSHTIAPTTDPTSPLWYPGGGGEQSLLDPNNVRFLARLRDELAAQGVNFAFWDMGTNGRVGEGRAWFDILKTWKQAGISIAAESSCDIASYVTGTNLFDQYQETFDYTMAKAVTPLARPVVLDRRTTLSNGQYWWDVAMAKGFVPIMEDYQMEIWAQQHGIVVNKAP